MNRPVAIGTSLAVALCGVFAVTVVSTFQHVGDLTQPANAVQTVAPVEVVEEPLPDTLSAINDYRASKGLAPVKLNASLNASAKAKADDLVSKNYFAHIHDDSTPWDFINATGYQWSYAGEDLAKCYVDGPAVVEAWIKSPAHEAILTGDYRDAGLGVTWSEENRCNYVVGHFGSRL